MPASVIVVGGGLAGLAAAAALGDAGLNVDLFESRPFLGGRATSYEVTDADEQTETIDNCQHILLRCCVNLLDFYRRVGVEHEIAFHKEFFFIEPGGRTSSLKAGALPAPLHFTEAFARASYLSLWEKVALGRALLALKRQRTTRRDLDAITMAQWLEEQKQPPRVVERFWRQVLVSAINEDLERMAAAHGFQVFWLGFLASSDSYQMGIPAVPLQRLYTSDGWSKWPNVRIHMKAAVDRLSPGGVQVAGELKTADYYVSCVPFDRLQQIAPELHPPQFEHSPITGIHLWFDRSITQLPHATLLDRTIQWMFNKDGGRYLQLVVSASRQLTPMPRQEVIDLAIRELADFFPRVREAKLEKAHVVKEVRATFSASPGLEERRPTAITKYPAIFLGGDWTRSGWPATMEGAVRSGYIAAAAVCQAAGISRTFLLPDIA
jgi:squalene-associated FAD-dependent desaturase